MNRTSLSLIPLAIALVGPLALASVQAGAAPVHTGKGPQAPVATGRQAPSSKMPGVAPLATFAGYQQVSSALLTDSAGTQQSGSASCPTGTALVGGGAIISSSSLGENLNASIPSANGSTWTVYVNNSSATSGTFRVYAVCVKRVAKYAVAVSATVDNPAGAQSSASVTCPQGTYPLGGGGFSTSGSTAVNLNTSIPTSKGWRTDVNNASTAGDTISAYAVCGRKPAGYAQVAGTASTINASTQGNAAATCPAGTLVLSGGGYSNSGSTAVNLNSTAPLSTTVWQSYEDNGSSAATSLTGYAVCATAH